MRDRTLQPENAAREVGDNFPYKFDGRACLNCPGTCCRGSGGYVWVTMEDIEDITAHKNMDLETFVQLYVRAVQGRLSLQERKMDGEHLCCMFDPYEARCTIYPVRPEQCRTYPFWEIYRDYPHRVRKACPGVSVLTT